MFWLFLLWAANPAAWAAKPLTFAWPEGIALDVTETISTTTTNMDDVGPETTRLAGTLRMRLLVNGDETRVRYLTLKDGVEKTVLDLVVSPDGRESTADTSALAAIAAESIATSSAKDPALGAFMAESLRRDLARATSDIGEGWARNVGLWVGRSAAKGATKAAIWTRSVATVQGYAKVAFQGTAVSEGKVPCTGDERAKRCVRLAATGQAESVGLAGLIAQSPEVLRYWVGPVPPGRGNAYPDEVKCTLSEVISIVTRPESLIPVSVETTLTVSVTLNRQRDPEFRRTVVATSRLDFFELSLFIQAEP